MAILFVTPSVMATDATAEVQRLHDLLGPDQQCLRERRIRTCDLCPDLVLKGFQFIPGGTQVMTVERRQGRLQRCEQGTAARHLVIHQSQ
jgi:hypothetical protein